MGKILLIDVDGTLVDYENHLPDSAVEAIRRARKNGHCVYICTGRSRAEVYDNIWAIGLDGMIGGNGSYLEDHGQVLLHKMLTSEQCRRAVDWLHARGLEFYLESNSGLFASEHFETAGEESIRLYAAGKGKEGAEDLRVRDAKVDIPLFECCGFSVCMGSGGPEARAAADYVTGDVDKDGLYNAFAHLGLLDQGG